MGISSLGVGSSILTQDVLDQLKAADQAQYVTPVDAKITEQNKITTELKTIDALMANLSDSISAINSHDLFSKRVTEVTGSAVEVSANIDTDIQEFALNVNNLATKEINQSGTFASSTATIATGSGQLKLSIGTSDFTIDYTSTTTLDDLKQLINKAAGDKVNATIVQVGAGDSRLFLSAANTGTNQNISITDVVGAGETLNTALSTGITNVQAAVDASFTFNGQAIVRTSNTVSDLVSGLSVTLKEAGVSNVSVKQDRVAITDALDKFVTSYNSAIYELDSATKSSQKASERGLLSSNNTIKTMNSMLKNMFSSVGEGVGKLEDYGFTLDRDSRLSLDKDVLNTKLDQDSKSVQAFFSGGTFTKSDGTEVQLTGAFVAIDSKVNTYTKYNATLDLLQTSVTDRITSLQTQKTLATERLATKYDIMAKRFAAYDLMISKLSSASSMFTEMANAQLNAQNN